MTQRRAASRAASRAAALGAAALLAACAAEPVPEVAAVSPMPRVARAAPEPVPSEASRAAAAHYRRVEAIRRTQGRLRADGGQAEFPADPETLTATFLRIALYEELAEIGGRIVAQERESRLHRWAGPVRLGLEFGGAVPAGQKAADSARLDALAARLAAITGHPVSTVATGANFHVLIVDEDARRALGPRLRAIFPAITAAELAEIVDMPRATYCLVAASDPQGDGTYDRAVAVIRAEQPDRMREACLHEEIAQGLGLANDSPLARPSIFNDDEEFALLTGLDELLLRILYDPRLSAGMSAAEAEPVVRLIVAETISGSS